VRTTLASLYSCQASSHSPRINGNAFNPAST